jgi:hypothetical protein
MDIRDLIEDLTRQQKSIRLVVQRLQRLSRLDEDRKENMPALVIEVARLEKSGVLTRDGEAATRKLTDWLEQYKGVLRSEALEMQKHLGSDLERPLAELGLTLSGQYPTLKAGLFTIETDFDHFKAIIWYGPRQERLAQCPLTARRIVEQVAQSKANLGSGLPSQEITEKIRDAYYEVAGAKRGEPAAIGDVLATLAKVFETGMSSRSTPRTYTRADFSYDLFRIRQSGAKSLQQSRLHLTVATRVHTKRRSGFLWVPEDETGRGTTYSHLRWEELSDGQA